MLSFALSHSKTKEKYKKIYLLVLWSNTVKCCPLEVNRWYCH